MKVLVLIKIKTNDEEKNFETSGIFFKNKNILVYKDQDFVINSVNFNNNIIKRKSNDYSLELFFNKNRISYCTITLKNGLINTFEIELKKLVKNDNYFFASYSIDDKNTIDYSITIKTKKPIDFK